MARRETFLSRIGAFLKRILGGAPPLIAHDLNVQFPPIEHDKLVRDLGIVKAARQFGARNVPSATAQSGDSVEQRIRSEMIQRLAVARDQVAKQVGQLEAAIRTRVLGDVVDRVRVIPEECETRIRREAERIETETNTEIEELTTLRTRLEAEIEELDAEVETYREVHRVKRRPRLKEKDEHQTILAAVGVVAIVQAGANAVLLAQGSDYGMAFGVGLAFVLMFFDLGAHFYLGRWASLARAYDGKNRVLGSVGATATVALLVAWNLGLVHLRNVTRAYGVEGWDRWLPSIIEAPLGFSDFLSWALLLVGGLCSGLTALAGFGWDEPVPVFRDNERLKARKAEDLREVKDRLSDLQLASQSRQEAHQKELLAAYRAELKKLEKAAVDHHALLNDHYSEIHRVWQAARLYEETVVQSFKALVRLYRDQNTAHRSAPAPQFFDLDPELGDHLELGVDPKALRGLLDQAERDFQRLRTMLPGQRELLREA
ncbi:MAG: hypothetical protein AMXMBFR53_39720 [Gemmatimonadota bacterium]